MQTLPTILVAEDDSNDALLLSVAFKKAGVPGALRFVQDGCEAVEYLMGIGAYANRLHYPFPSLMLVDLQLPGMSGFELLEWIRSNGLLTRLRVGVLSGMEHEDDISKAARFGASFYLVKPHSFEDLVCIARRLLREMATWQGVEALPDFPGAQAFGRGIRPKRVVAAQHCP
jgi:CheY-like chemotaxis protein